MRIGLTGGAATADKLIEQAQKAEADGFTSLWYASIVQGDPLVSMALAGRATQRIELGTAVLQTYPCHPVLQARRAASVVAAMGRPGFTLGVGPSHEANIRQHYGMSYDRPAKNTEEYLAILGAVLRNEAVDVDGEEWSAHLDAGATPLAHPVPVLVAALAPRMLRAAGALGDGAILWIAPVAAIERMAAVVRESAAEAGRPAPRIVSGLVLQIVVACSGVYCCRCLRRRANTGVTRSVPFRPETSNSPSRSGSSPSSASVFCSTIVTPLPAASCT